MTNDEWLTIQEAADHLKLSVPAIRKYVRLGKLPHYRQGRIVRIKRSDLDSFLHLGQQPAPAAHEA
jgi:excisionase family DNA binding protein